MEGLEKCPICGGLFDDSDDSVFSPSSELAQHFYKVHRDVFPGLRNCWCGHYIAGLSIRPHIKESGGWHQHWVDHLLVVK